MYIHEAIQARTQEKPYIARKSWNYPTRSPVFATIRILPTDTPDCCVIESVNSERGCRGWEPRTSDLVADDWEPVGL